MTTPKLTKAQRELLNDALVDMAGRLRPITVRGLYYQAVISSALPFIQKDHDGERTFYRMVQTRVLKLRHSGAIDWDWVVDESRSAYGVPRWTNPADFADIAPLYYSLDLWDEQSVRPLLLVEKAGQVPVYRDHAASHGVDVAACKGYGSATYLRNVAMTIGDWLTAGQDVQVIVAADFDPSGCDWPRAAFADIAQHLANRIQADFDPDDDHDLNHLLAEAGHGQLRWHRELVQVADLAAMGTAVALRAPNPKDSRTQAWLEHHGFDATQETCVEMDAINPVEARERLGRCYLSLFDGDIQERLDLQYQHRDAITAALADLAGGEL